MDCYSPWPCTICFPGSRVLPDSIPPGAEAVPDLGSSPFGLSEPGEKSIVSMDTDLHCGMVMFDVLLCFLTTATTPVLIPITQSSSTRLTNLAEP